MSEPHEPPPPPPSSLQPPPPLPPVSLYKQKSWSPDVYREEAWLRRKSNSLKHRRSKSVTDEDLDELKACIELGFGFDSPEVVDQRLSDTLPALELYYAVNKNYNDSRSKPNSTTTISTTISTTSYSSPPSECDTLSPLGSPHTMFGPGHNPQAMKTRLRQWAQVVACSVRQSSS